MTQKSSSRGEEAGSTKGPASFCEPALIRWYLELERERVLKRLEEDDAVHSTGAKTGARRNR